MCRNEFHPGPLGYAGLYFGRRLREASSLAGLAFLIHEVWPHAVWLAIGCAVLAVLLPERK